MSTVIINPFQVQAASVVTPFFSETFEGSDDNTWTDVGASINRSYTTSPISGSQSLRITPLVGLEYTSAPIPAKDTIYGRFRVKPIGHSGGGGSLTLSRLGVANDFVFQIQNNARAVIRHGINSSIDSTTVFVDGSVYTIWFKYVKAASGDGIYEVWISSAGSTTKPGSPEMAQADGTSTAQPGVVAIQATTSDDLVFDDIQLADSALS